VNSVRQCSQASHVTPCEQSVETVQYVDKFNNHVLDILPGELGVCCLELISETILTAVIVVYYSANIVKENDEIVVD
jgi:hypothetical protein